MAKKNIKTNLLHHSEAKVRLLGEYLKRYLNIISNDGYTEKINIFDLFCGPGIYEDDGEGSPVVALRQIKETYYTIIDRKPIKLPKINCHFNDIDKIKIRRLEQAIETNSLHYNHFGDIQLTSNDYKNEIEKLKQLFKVYKHEKAFVFIDPYGYKEVKAEHIKGLIDCNRKSEVLLWLPIQFMYRFAEEGTPEVLRSFIEELSIKSEMDSVKNVWEFISVLKIGFQKYLGDKFYVDNFSLRKEENTVFCLYFFTSHIRGFEKMLEAKWEIDTEQGRGWEYTGNTPSLFFHQKTNELEEKLSGYIKANKVFNGDIYEYSLRQGYLPKHTNEIFKEWMKSNTFEVYLENNKIARRGAFYTSYENYKDSPNKVYFKLK